MSNNLGHIWVRDVPNHLVGNKFSNLLCLVVCSKCGVPKVHKDALEYCSGEHIFEYMELLNGDFSKLEQYR